jgi:hypothetical protein
LSGRTAAPYRCHRAAPSNCSFIPGAGVRRRQLGPRHARDIETTAFSTPTAKSGRKK